jgi:hypothetical protein
MNKGNFKKGNIPWNKGVYVRLSPKSEFKKGKTTLEDHPSWKGGVQFAKHDCVHLMLGTNKRVRRPKFIYEKVYGKIPKGDIIYHKDGNKDNDDIRNLICISRAELVKLNKLKSAGKLK